MPTPFKPYAVSIALHATAMAALYVVPLAKDQQFASQGRSEVVSIQASQFEPVSQVEVTVPTEQFPLSFEEPAVPRNDQTPPERMSPQQLTRLENEPASIPLPQLSMPQERPDFGIDLGPIQRERDQTVPEIDPTAQLPRPRRDRANRRDPAVMSMPLQFAGVEKETSADLSSNQPPAYPAEAVARQLEGVVLLNLKIDSTGRVTDVQVIRSSGHGILDRVAVDAVSRWRGTPAQRWGRPVESTERLPIRFRL